MVVWFAHVRVGHRQLSILDKAPFALALGAFLCVWFGDNSLINSRQSHSVK